MSCICSNAQILLLVLLNKMIQPYYSSCLKVCPVDPSKSVQLPSVCCHLNQNYRKDKADRVIQGCVEEYVIPGTVKTFHSVGEVFKFKCHFCEYFEEICLSVTLLGTHNKWCK